MMRPDGNMRRQLLDHMRYCWWRADELRTKAMHATNEDARRSYERGARAYEQSAEEQINYLAGGWRTPELYVGSHN